MVYYITNQTTKHTEINISSLCKIEQINNIHFAITGYAGNISLIEARNACQKAKSVFDAIKLYIQSFGQKLADILETDRMNKVGLFENKFSAGGSLGGSVFFHYENGTIIGHVVKFTLVSQATIATRSEYMDLIGIVGSSIGIKNIIYNKDVWKKGGVKGINNLINIEKMANPFEVEGLADILYVSNKNEIEWVQRKKCP